jgi:hypothetical protein
VIPAGERDVEGFVDRPPGLDEFAPFAVEGGGDVEGGLLRAW